MSYLDQGISGDNEARLTPGSGSVGDDEEQEDDSGDNDSIITVKPKDIEGHLSLSEVSKSVKAFIGMFVIFFCCAFFLCFPEGTISEGRRLL